MLHKQKMEEANRPAVDFELLQKLWSAQTDLDILEDQMSLLLHKRHELAQIPIKRAENMRKKQREAVLQVGSLRLVEGRGSPQKEGTATHLRTSA